MEVVAFTKCDHCLCAWHNNRKCTTCTCSGTAPAPKGGWVSRAVANTLPVFTTHQGAFAYRSSK